MNAHIESLQAIIEVKTKELDDAWRVIAELRRQLYICSVMRGLFQRRLEDELSKTGERALCTDPPAETCADPACPEHGDIENLMTEEQAKEEGL